MKELILIKFGGSLITDKDKPYVAKPGTIKRLAKEIKFCWGKGFRFLISHGSGSFGHTSAAKYKTASGIKNNRDVYGLAVVQQDALAINRIVNKTFLERGLPVLSFIPSSFTLAQNKNLFEVFTAPIVEALKINVLPLVFGDIILDTKRGCCIFSGERTLDNLIKPLIKEGFTITRIIQCGTTDGVYDAEGKTIPFITKQLFQKFQKTIGVSSSTDVTGGMLHKVEESLEIAGLGVASLIISGQKPGNLKKTILGEKVKGTLIK